MTTFNVYVRENVSDLKTTLATGLTSPSYSVSGLTKGKKYLFSVGAERNGAEKVSDEKEIFFGELWTPEHMATAKSLWLDGDSIILDESNRVSMWLDKTGSGQDFTPGAPSTQPSLSELNGNRIAVFDGVDDYLNCGTLQHKDIFRNVGKGWIFMLSKRISGFTNVITHNAGGSNRNNLRLGRGSTMGSSRLDSGSVVNPVGTGTAVGEWGLAMCEADWAGGKLYLQLDGSSPLTSPAFSPGLTSDTQSNDGTTLGAFRPGDSFTKCEIACVIAGSNSLPSQAEIDKLMGWAAHKYGLTANLPAGHPYKTLAPTI